MDETMNSRSYYKFKKETIWHNFLYRLKSMRYKTQTKMEIKIKPEWVAKYLMMQNG